MTLYSRLVGVTAGLGVPRTLTWNGSSSTAPEIPAGVASTAIAKAAARATSSAQPPLTIRQSYRARPQSCRARPGDFSAVAPRDACEREAVAGDEGSRQDVDAG